MDPKFRFDEGYVDMKQSNFQLEMAQYKSKITPKEL